MRNITFPRRDIETGQKRNFHLPVADEQELLEFANKVREAGGANPISALLPSHVNDPHSCLIARNLNFDCVVMGMPRPPGGEALQPDGSYIWGMWFDNQETRNKVAAHLDLEHYDDYPPDDGDKKWAVILPAHIGNAADAFDAQLAFQNFAILS